MTFKFQCIWHFILNIFLYVQWYVFWKYVDMVRANENQKLLLRNKCWWLWRMLILWALMKFPSKRLIDWLKGGWDWQTFTYVLECFFSQTSREIENGWNRNGIGSVTPTRILSEKKIPIAKIWGRSFWRLQFYDNLHRGRINLGKANLFFVELSMELAFLYSNRWHNRRLLHERYSGGCK